VRLLDLMFSPAPEAELRRALRASPPQAVALSVRNLDNTTMEKPENYLPALLPLVQVIRNEGIAHLILGGAAIGIAPEPILRLTGADWAVVGAGEEAFPRLLGALDAGRPPGLIPGVAQVRNGTFGLQPPEVATQAPFSFPDLKRWVDLRRYRREGGTYPLQSKRGCSFECVYCPCPRIEGSAYRLAPPSRVAAEVGRLAAAGVRDIEFVDTVFNAPYQHALEICGEIARRRPRARLHTFELNPAFVDAPLLFAMEAAGFAAVGITAESAAGPVLAELGKNYAPEHLEKSAAALRRSRPPCLWIFMLGGPGETAGTVAESLRFARQQLGPNDAAFFSLGIRIYPQTPLERRARAEGLLPQGRDLADPAFYLSPEIEPTEVQAMVREAVRADHRFITFDMESLRFLPAIRGLAGRLGLAPPLWRHTARMRSVLARFGVREQTCRSPARAGRRM